MNTQQTPIQKLLNIPIDNATYTDIHKAVIKGNLQRLKLYLDRGPGPWGTVDSLDWWGRSPLYRAVEKNYIPIVLEILIQGASVDLKEKDRSFFAHLGLPETLISKLEPFFGLSGMEAKAEAPKLNISKDVLDLTYTIYVNIFVFLYLYCV